MSNFVYLGNANNCSDFTRHFYRGFLSLEGVLGA